MKTTHFILGASAAGSLSEGFPDTKIFYWHDRYDSGPCRFDGAADPPGWVAARSEWFAEWDREAPAFSFVGSEEPVRFEDVTEGLEDALLWIADGVIDQLHGCMLAWALPPNVRLRHGRPENTWRNEPFCLIGLVYPATFASAPVSEISRSERERMASLWEAFTEPTPRRFFELAGEAGGSPRTRHLHHLVSRFPFGADGLTLWERLLLQGIRENAGKSVAHTIAPLLSHSPDHVGDCWLFDLVHELAEDELLTPPGDGLLGKTFVELTDLGEAILGGERHRVDEVGFDRWFGGTHLSSDETMWWRSDGSVTPDRP